jgi:hypothetical protein
MSTAMYVKIVVCVILLSVSSYLILEYDDIQGSTNPFVCSSVMSENNEADEISESEQYCLLKSDAV